MREHVIRVVVTSIVTVAVVVTVTLITLLFYFNHWKMFAIRRYGSQLMRGPPSPERMAAQRNKLMSSQFRFDNTDLFNVMLHMQQAPELGAHVLRGIDLASPPAGAIWVERDRAIVSLRGAHGNEELAAITDQTPVPGLVSDSAVLVHRGFFRMYSAFADSAIEFLARSRPVELVIGGFSTGGAFAQLLAVSILDQRRTGRISWPLERLVVCAIGSPRVGNAMFANRLEKNELVKVVVVVNIEDVVPLLPLGFQGYSHPKDADVYVFARRMKNELENHVFETYTSAAESGELTLLRRPSIEG